MPITKIDKDILEKIADRDFFKIPKELKGKYTKDEFHTLMTANHSDIPIENVEFKEYPLGEK